VLVLLERAVDLLDSKRENKGLSVRQIGLARSVVSLLICALFAAASTAVAAGETVGAIKSRGQLRCGVSEGIPGLSAKDAAGRWAGMDADFCRAVAGAVLGNPNKVQFVPLKASARFPALQAGRIDLLARNTTWTMSREVLLHVQFPGVLLYDGQAFMVPATASTDVMALPGAPICVEKGTTHEQNLVKYYAARSVDVAPLVIDSAAGAAAALFAGKCRAYSSDATQLAALRLQAPAGAGDFVILPERISKEPLGPVVRGEDPAWASVVRWVLYALIEAEERGVVQANAETAVAAALARAGSSARAKADWDYSVRELGLRPDWAAQAIKAAGNYGEIFERNLGAASALHLDRGLNRLWTEGGLMYAPPLN
jgi:general L-amino acid transport system substrate-binding protein